MALDQNVAPYYNDYNEDYNFHQIMFQPGVSVQSRELIQLHSILQKQIERVGTHIFKDGSVVSGGEVFVENTTFVKLNETAVDISGYQDLYAKSGTGEVHYIIKYAVESVASDLETLYLKSIGSSFDLSSDVGYNETLIADEVLTIYNTKADMIAGTNPVTTHTVVSVGTDAVPTGQALMSYVSAGIFYSNGNFIRSDDQRAIINKYATTGNYSVGFNVDERYVTVNDVADNGATLRDPASGSYNELAPGADRLKFELQLEVKLVTADTVTLTTDKWVELVRLNDGIITERLDEVQYNKVADELARRTYEESGDYVLEPFEFNAVYHNTDETKLNMRVGQGSAYVKGYEIDKIVSTLTEFNKARDTESVLGVDVQSYFGNYINVESLSDGLFDINGVETVELHSSTTPSATTKIGDAHIKSLEYVSGTGATTLMKLFVFDTELTGTISLAATRSIIGGTWNAITAKADVHSSSISDRTIVTTYGNATPTLTVPLNSNIRVGDSVTGTGIAADSIVTAYADTTVTLNNNTTSAGTEGLVFSGAFLTDTSFNTSLYKPDSSFIKSMDSVSYKSKKMYASIAVASGAVSSIFTNTPVPGETTERFANATPNKHLHYQMVIKTVTGGVSYTAGDFVDMDQVTITEVTVGATVADEVSFVIDDGGDFIGTVDILVTLDITKDLHKTKTLVSDHNVDLNVISADTVYSLGICDVNFDSIKVYQSSDNGGTAEATTSDTDVTSSYVLDNGQRDNIYDHATVKLKAGLTAPTAQILVVCDYFTHSIGLGYFSAGSYPDYATISDYTPTNSSTAIQLRDYLDFRARRTDTASGVYASTVGASFDYQQQVAPAYALADTDYTYYLSRKDVITLDKNGNFQVLEGISSLTNPRAPNVPEELMGMFTLNVSPYTYTTKDVKITPISVRRYTMRDVSNLDNRLSNVEYYTALNAVENEVANTSYTDTEGNALFNNGFLVDNFKGHAVGDVYNTDYSCSVDNTEQVLHPRIKNESFKLNRLSGGLVESGKFTTLPYTETSFISQKVVSSSVSINPFDVAGFVGYAVLTPHEDVWVDTSTRPEVIVNDLGEMDAYESALNFEGTEWGAWSRRSRRRSGNYIKTTSTRSGTETYVDRDDYVKSTSTSSESKVIKYIRSSVIEFELHRMRPNREIKLMFDGTNITHTLEGWDGISAYVLNQNLTTDANGYLKGRFTIPNNAEFQFLTGIKNILFTDNVIDIGNSSTYAQSSFLTDGTNHITEKTTVMGIRYDILTRSVSDSNTSARYSPVVIAPAYSAPARSESVYVDVFDTSFTASTTSVNSYATGSGGSISYQSGHFTPTATTTISDANMQAISDVYTSNFGRKPDAAGANYWASAVANGTLSMATVTANILASGVTNGEKCLLSDPTAQTFMVSNVVNPDGLFLSSIDVFFETADDELPVTLEIRPVVNGFPSSSEAIPGSQVTLIPSQVTIPADTNVPEATNFVFDNPLYLQPAEYAIVLLSDSARYFVYISDVTEVELVTGAIIGKQPHLGSYFKSQNARTWTADQNKDLMFQINKCVFDTSIAYSSVYETELPDASMVYDALAINASENNIPGTSLDIQLATTPVSGSIGTYAYVSPNTEVYISGRQEHIVTSDTLVKAWMSSSNPDVSPYINVDTFSIITIENLINAVNSAEVIAAPETANDGGALSKYITRPVSLADGFNAKSLKVFALENLQAGTQFEVYYKVLSDEDSGRFEDKAWVKMTKDGQASYSSSLTEYNDTSYTAEGITYTSGSATFSSFKTFAVKMVMYSTNSAFTPTAKKLRVIALS